MLHFREVEAKDYQLQIDQTLSKTDSQFSNTNERKSGKHKSSKKQPRRSPYQPPALSHTDTTVSSQTAAEIHRTSYPEVPLTMPSYPAAAMVYPQDNERYSTWYHSQYMGQTPYANNSFPYTYSASQPYGSSYDGRHLQGGHNSYGDYLTPQAQTGGAYKYDSRTPVSEARADARTPVSPRYDCMQMQQQSSRASSCEAPAYNNTNAHGYPMLYSNRSESSTSEVDVMNEDFDRQKRGDRRSGSKFDSLVEATQQLVKDEVLKLGSHGNVEKSRRSSSRRENGQPSVIMRCPGQSEQNYTNNVRGTHDQGTDAYSPCLKGSPGEHGDQTLHTLPPSTRDVSSHLLAKTVGYEGATRGSEPGSHFLTTIRTLNSKDPTANMYTNCLKSACGYDTYNPYSTPIQGPRPYSVMHQTGYTSVIVDTQQYQMTNGYVH